MLMKPTSQSQARATKKKQKERLGKLWVELRKLMIRSHNSPSPKNVKRFRLEQNWRAVNDVISWKIQVKLKT